MNETTERFFMFADANNLFRVNVTFINKDGSRTPVTGHVGQHVLDLAHKNGIDLEGGATIFFCF